jgi:predicted transposase/invertase (TIGR01784 family)
MEEKVGAAVNSDTEATLRSDAIATRNYKNNVFVDYIGTKERLIEVYNAVKGTNYPKDTDIQINTLKNVLYRFIQNDISFVLDGKLVVLMEHQSTLNENMPIRFLEYISKVYEHMIDKKAYYKRESIMLPRPEFIVFYNGKDDYAEKQVMKLSEAYYDNNGESLELTATVYNINQGMNADILEKSRALFEYATLTSKIHEYSNAGHALEEAIDLAVKYCMGHDIMIPYLEEHGSEIMSILVQEYNFEDELQVAKEEAEERGIRKGRADGIAQGFKENARANARNMKADGMEMALIVKYTGLSEADIAEL